jgi:nicotinate-nucleotide adenylyltransferase
MTRNQGIHSFPELLHMRLGLFGGTFNPIHRGHLHVVNAVRCAFDLIKIYLIPAAIPPHKISVDIADAQDRIEMIRLSTTESSHLCVTDVELKRPGPSYTIDTVRYFRSDLPEHAILYLIMGLDAFLEINTWKFYSDLLRLVPCIVVSRPGLGGRDDRSDQSILENYLISRISSRYTYSMSLSAYNHPKNKPVYWLEVTPCDISSTEIRRRVKSGKSIRNLVPDPVATFIQEKGLYR